MRNMKCSVIGNGALALSVAIQLSQKGCTVTYIDISENQKIKNRYLDKPEIVVIDRGRYSVSLSKVTDNYESVQNAHIIVIAVTSSCYEPVFAHILPLIHTGQHVLFMPACYGAILFKKALRESKIKDLTISEATSFPYVCDLSDEGLIVHGKKQTLTIAVSPLSKLDSEITLYNSLFEIFQPARNFLQTSLDNMNLTLHPLPILLNISAVEHSASSFRHYIDGYSETVGQLVERMDAERIAIGEKLDLPLTTALTQLKNYYGDSQAQTIREYVTNLQGPYPDVKGFGLDSRYVTEDVPGLLVSASSIASQLGIKVPIIDLCISLANAITNRNFHKSGFTIEKLGFDKLTTIEIQNTIEH